MLTIYQYMASELGGTSVQARTGVELRLQVLQLRIATQDPVAKVSCKKVASSVNTPIGNSQFAAGCGVYSFRQGTQPLYRGAGIVLNWPLFVQNCITLPLHSIQ